jgi:asparagine synthase (glutamine-hydrolysing)
MIPSIFKPLFKHPNPECVDWVGEGFKKKYYRNIKKPDRFEDELNNYLYHIFRSSILPGLLHYEDRNSMAYSIETRLPFLDYRLVEFSFSLPMKFKIREGVNKFILREAMKGILPEKIRTRMDKMGFVTPESDWLKTTLRDFIHTIFKSNSFYERGFFDIAKVQQGFQDHCNGKVDHHTMIWRCVSLELWWRMFIDNSMSNQRAVDG